MQVHLHSPEFLIHSIQRNTNHFLWVVLQESHIPHHTTQKPLNAILFTRYLLSLIEVPEIASHHYLLQQELSSLTISLANKVFLLKAKHLS